jgi:hypothetical protein
MKTSEVFTRAKQNLAKDYDETCNSPTKEKFICIAITTAAAYTKRITDKDVERCEDVIKSRMDGAYTLEGWLAARGCVAHDYFQFSRTTKDRIQAHRHAWLDLLIAEFEAQGH